MTLNEDRATQLLVSAIVAKLIVTQDRSPRTCRAEETGLEIQFADI